MFSDDDAGPIARAFGLGEGAAFTGAVARGEQGQVAQLETSRGLWAVKTSFRPPERDGEDGDFQAAAVAAGVPAPAVMFTDGGGLFTDIGGLPVRVYGWVDVLAPDSGLDPGRVGQLLAAIHQVPFRGRRPPDPWYTEPVGAAGWDRLVHRLTAADAPFAVDLAAMRDELVALEELLVPARELRTCHRALCYRLGQLRVGRPGPGAGRRPVRVRMRRRRPSTGALWRVPPLRRPGAGRAARRLLDDDRPARPHQRDVLPDLARPGGIRRGAETSGVPVPRERRDAADGRGDRRAAGGGGWLTGARHGGGPLLRRRRRLCAGKQ